jgi:hypothetical protein
VYAVDEKLRCIAVGSHPDADVDGITAELRGRGLAVGHHDDYRPFVWVANGPGLTVWSDEGRVLDAFGGWLTHGLGVQRRIPTADIRAVVGYADPVDFVDRGVKVELPDGKLRTVLWHLSLHASGDPTYNRNDLLCDTGWVVDVAKHLGAWACVPVRFTF